MKSVYYDVYEGKELVLQCVTKDEINRALGCNVTSMANYADTGYKINKRYTVIRVSEKKAKQVKEASPSFVEEWAAAVSPFKRVIWSKEEGRKLKRM